MTFDLRPRCLRIAILLAIHPLMFGIAQAATISNGTLAIQIQDGNGAIGSASLGGVEFFRTGAYVSDWGMQTSTNTSTFAINSANGNEGIAATVAANSTYITATGTYTSGGNNIGITRTYSLVEGMNVLRIESSLTNNGGGPVTLRYFETFDPDQVDYSNAMDRYTLGTAEVAGATHASGPTVILGSPTPFSALASGSPFIIADGTALNNLFAAPFDGNGASYDQGIHGAMEALLAAGGSYSATYFLSFGTTKTAAESAFIASLATVPEPSVPLLGVLAAGAFLGRRRRK